MPTAQQPVDGSAVGATAGAAGTASRIGTILTSSVILFAVAIGALERFWLLVHTPLYADSAVVGLMADQIAHGHFMTFYWDQPFGGVEPYVVALVTRVVPGPFGLNLSEVVLSALAAVFVGLIVRELCGSRTVGALAGAMAWVWPYGALWNSTRELGFHFAALVLGLAMLYFAIRANRGHSGVGTMAALGLSGGLGFWASPEITYFVVPTLIVLLASFRKWFSPRNLLVMVSGAAVGALPWLYTNLHSGFRSLHSGVLDTSGFGQRLHTFFQQALPLEFGTRILLDGGWLRGTSGEVAFALIVGLGIVAVIMAFWHFFAAGGDVGTLACAVGLLAFPLIWALNTKSAYWIDGRYVIAVGCFYVVTLFAALGSLRRVPSSAAPMTKHRADDGGARWGWVIPGLGILVCAATALTIAQAGVRADQASQASFHTGVRALFSGWNDPNRDLEAAVAAMQAAGIRDAFADYWVAYNIDYLHPWNLEVSPSVFDAVRSPGDFKAVARSTRPAWIFTAPSETTRAARSFGGQEGPGPYAEKSFVSVLGYRGIRVRVVHLGVLDAVIPDRTVVTP